MRTHENPEDGQEYCSFQSPFQMPKWRNWQTRTFEGRVRQLVGVRVPPSAPISSLPSYYIGRSPIAALLSIRRRSSRQRLRDWPSPSRSLRGPDERLISGRGCLSQWILLLIRGLAPNVPRDVWTLISFSCHLPVSVTTDYYVYRVTSCAIHASHSSELAIAAQKSQSPKLKLASAHQLPWLRRGL